MALCGTLSGLFLFAACAWATGYRQGVRACEDIGPKAIFVVPTESKWMLAAAALLGLGAIALK